MKIIGKLGELLDLVRACEYLRIANNCDGCIIREAIQTDDAVCMGIDVECQMEVDDGVQEDR